VDSNGTQSYRRTKVLTADPKRLVLMCYEGTIDNLKIGKQQIAQKDYEGKARALTKAQDIIDELLCALDYEKGGSIAKNLDSLYNYMLRRIIHVDLKNDLRAVDEVIGMLTELKAAWEEIPYNGDSEIEPENTRLGEDRRRASAYISA